MKISIDDLWMCFCCGECPRQSNTICPSCGSGVGICNIGINPSRGLRPPYGNYKKILKMVQNGESKKNITNECKKILKNCDYYKI